MMTPHSIPQVCLDSEFIIPQLLLILMTVTLLPISQCMPLQVPHNLLPHYLSDTLLSMSPHMLVHCDVVTKSILDLLSI